MNLRKILMESVDPQKLNQIVLNVLNNVGTVGNFKVEKLSRAQQGFETENLMNTGLDGFRMTFTARPMKVKVQDWIDLLSKENPKYKRIFANMPTSQLTLATLLDFNKNEVPRTPKEREWMSGVMKLYQRAQQEFITTIKTQIENQIGPAFDVFLNPFDFKETGKQLRTEYEIIILGDGDIVATGTPIATPTAVPPAAVPPATPKKPSKPRKPKAQAPVPPPTQTPTPTGTARLPKHQMTVEETEVLMSAIETTIGATRVQKEPTQGAGIYYTLRDKSMKPGSMVTFVTDSYYRQDTLPMFMGYYTIDGGKTSNKSKWNEMMAGIQQFYKQERAKEKGQAEPVQRSNPKVKSRNSRFGGQIGNKLRRLVSDSKANDEILIYAEMKPKVNPFTQKNYPWGGTVVFHIFEIAPLGTKG